MSESMITKKAIADSLKELTRHKTFNKISISDITKECNLNRQTFYYHFQDKYELLDWIYYNYTFKSLIENISFDNWNDRLMELLEIMKKEETFYMNTIKCSENYFEEYLFKLLVVLFKAAIEALDDDKKLPEDEKNVFARFFSHGLCGIIIDWAINGMKESVEELNRHIKYLVISSEKAAYKHFINESS